MPTQTPPNLIKIQDTFAPAGKDIIWTLNEDVQSTHNANYSGKVDGTAVLGRVVGEGFLINGVSNNRRFYSRELWEKQRVKRENDLNSGGLFGAFGHEQDLDAVALGEGKASHLVTDFWIDEEGIGKIEFLILNTETGRNLNTYYRAGKKMAVSSRGFGSIKETTHDGIDILDPDTFYSAGWDIVVDPGVSTAFPPLVESNENNTTHTNKPLEENKTMDETTKQLISLNEAKAKAEAKVEIMEANNKAAQALNENEQLKAKLALYEEKVGSLDDVKALNEGLWKWLTIEPFKSYAKQIGLHQDQSLKGLFPKMNPTIEAFESAAKADQAELAAYRELGKVESLKTITEKAEQYGRLVKLENLQKMGESFKKIAKQLKNNSRTKKINEAVVELEKLFPNVKKEHIQKFLESMKPADAIATIKTMNEAYKPATAAPAAPANGKPASGKVNESANLNPFQPVPLSSITNAQPLTPSKEANQGKRLNESMLVPMPTK